MQINYIKKIGGGSYGNVWKCKDQTTNQIMAVKFFIDTGVDSNNESVKMALREIKVARRLKHPNIIKMIDAFRVKDNNTIVMVMEFVDHNLQQELKRNKRGLSRDIVKSFMWQLLSATAYMHSNGIMHRDLKPANILVSANRQKIKVCDFGFARNIKSESCNEYTPYMVTRWYRAPEILTDRKYGPKVDIWAIGCIFAELLTGRPLCPGCNTLDQLEKVRDLADKENIVKRFPHFSKNMMQVLLACLNILPEHRLTASQILSLLYFDDVHTIKFQIACTCTDEPCIRGLQKSNSI